MALQNRVQPDGSIIRHPTYGTLMGNRGILHDADQQLGKARWRHKAWVTCVLAFKGRHRDIMRPGNYTELFFLDEAVAFAAGHRPCGECRRADFNRFRAAAGITAKISAYDGVLHAARAEPRTYRQIHHRAALRDLPEGTFVRLEDGAICLLAQDALFPYADMQYHAPRSTHKIAEVTVLTPAPLVTALREGYDYAYPPAL